jgi:hypothetical protein
LSADHTERPVERHVEHTDWLDGYEPDAIDGLYAAFVDKHALVQKVVVEILGPPDRAMPEDSGWFESWWPEVVTASAWRTQGLWLCLAVEHQDRETPISLLLRSVTDAELAELSA